MRSIRLHRDAARGDRAPRAAADPGPGADARRRPGRGPRHAGGPRRPRRLHRAHRRGPHGARRRARGRSRTRWRPPAGRRRRVASRSSWAAATCPRSARWTRSTSSSSTARCVVLKVHPVMAHLTDVVAAALGPFVREGVLRIVSGDAAQGAHLVAPPGRRHAPHHGLGPDLRRDRVRDRAPRARPAGCATSRCWTSRSPPSSATSRRSSWSRAAGRTRELDHHAEHIATMLTNNAGFNCTASRVIVTAAGWPQRDALMDRIRRRLGALPTRLAYYPGAAERFGAFRAAHPDAELFGDAARRPPAVDAHRRPLARRRRRPVLPGRGVLQHHRRDPDRRRPTPATFLDRATDFVNERVWGTLNATRDRGPADGARPGRGAGARAGRGPAALRDRRPELLVGGGVRDGHHARGARRRATRATPSGRGPGSSTTR